MQIRSKKGWVDAYTSSVEWPPPYASAQSYHPGGNHGQLFRPQGDAISDNAEAPLPLLHPSAFPNEYCGKAAVLSQHQLKRFVVRSCPLLSHFRSLQCHAQTFARDFFIWIEVPFISTFAYHRFEGFVERSHLLWDILYHPLLRTTNLATEDKIIPETNNNSSNNIAGKIGHFRVHLSHHFKARLSAKSLL